MGSEGKLKRGSEKERGKRPKEGEKGGGTACPTNKNRSLASDVGRLWAFIANLLDVITIVLRLSCAAFFSSATL